MQSNVQTISPAVDTKPTAKKTQRSSRVDIVSEIDLTIQARLQCG